MANVVAGMNIANFLLPEQQTAGTGSGKLVIGKIHEL